MDIGQKAQVESWQACAFNWSMSRRGNSPSPRNQPGEIVRALAWAGPERVESVLEQIGHKVPKSELQKVAQQVARFPGWVASALSRSAVNA